MKVVAIVLVLVLVLPMFLAAQTPPPGRVSADALKQRLDRGDKVLVIDVRENEEVAAGSIPRAVHIPMHKLATRMRDIPKDTEIVFLCAAGVRSAQAAEMFRKNGYRATQYCSMEDWDARRFPHARVKTPSAGTITPVEK